MSPDTPANRPATEDETEQTIAFALRFDGRKRIDTAGEAMARHMAIKIREHLERSGFVIMNKPPSQYTTR